MRTRTTTELNSPILRPGVLRETLEQSVAKAAFETERKVKEKMQEPKHGRTYRRGRITRAASAKLPTGLRTYQTAKGNTRAIVGYKLHRASAPGEAPAVDQSILINSIQAKPEGLRGIIRVGASYAGILEYERDRPVFEPTLEEMRPGFIAEVDQAVGRLC
jgi:hypothetical protein